MVEHGGRAWRAIRTAASLGVTALLATALLWGCSGDSAESASSGGAGGGDAGKCPKATCSGACVDLESDLSNCGKCGVACAQGEVCSKGKCALGCGAGTVACGNTCHDTQTDPENCGKCGTACGAGEVCSKGSCALSCGGGTTQCGASCVDTKVDPANCGACGTVCAAGEVCATGKCALSCPPGLVNCNGSCVDPQTNNGYCGASGDCQGANAGTACASGQVCSGGGCALTCQQGLIDCNGSCVDPQANNSYCGASGDCQGANSGTACASGQVCSAGNCALSCQQGLIDCNGTCVDPQTNNTYCGATGDCQGANSGTACASGQVCAGGTCALSCQQGLIDCNGTCVDPLTNGAFCGATGDCQGANAGTSCAAGQVCSAGSCALSCQQGLIDCNGTCVDPLINNAYCGASGDCAGANAGTPCAPGQTCSNGTCGTVCAPGLSECGTECLDLESDRDHCGACTTACAVSQDCSHGQCCPAGSSYCGGGCMPTSSNPSNCGDCGVQCSGSSPVCVNGTCVASCPTGFTLANGKCSKTYVVTASQVIGSGYQGDICTTGDNKVYDYSYYQKCPTATYTHGDNEIGFYWQDAGPSAGFFSVSRVDVSLFTTGYTSYRTCPAGGTCTWHTFTQTAYLQGQNMGTYTDGTASSPTCPTAPVQKTLSATGAPLSGYLPGQINQILISHPAPATCSSTSTYCCSNEYYYVGMSVHSAWGANAVALVTVTY